jgi:LacI family transcriptional regulator
MKRKSLGRQAGEPAIVRLKDVAMRAGCSAATVSRVINRPERVDHEVRARVDAAIRALGYVRDGAALALRSRRTRMIGAVVPTLNHAIYAHLLEALQGYVSQHGYSLLVTTSDFLIDQETRQVRLLLERGAEGLVLVGHTHEPELYSALESKNVPFINTYTYQPASTHPSAGFDNRAASRQVTEYLLDLGHRHVALIVGFRKDNDRVNDRIAGTLDALAARGIRHEPVIMEEPYSIEGGREGVRRILAEHRRPTALICGSDVLAFGAIIECDSMGIAIPQEISIIGFDDLEFAAHLRPPLTTIQVPAALMGRRAAAYLLARIADQPHAAHCPLETSLIVRRSVAPPKRR